MVGEGIDTIIFYPLAFYGYWPQGLLIKVMITSYCVKVLWELISVPATYRIVSFLKRVENEDYYDHNTNFSPFSLRS